VLARIAGALCVGGLLLFDLATPRRAPAVAKQTWTELHRLRLHRPAEVLGALRAAGFAARTLPGGYAGVPLPRGLVAYLARKR
jgi:hypothetical protein